MPIIVNELIIKATVEADGGDAAANRPANNETIDRAELIEMCVDEVLRILKQREER